MKGFKLILFLLLAPISFINGADEDGAGAAAGSDVTTELVKFDDFVVLVDELVALDVDDKDAISEKKAEIKRAMDANDGYGYNNVAFLIYYMHKIGTLLYSEIVTIPMNDKSKYVKILLNTSANSDFQYLNRMARKCLLNENCVFGNENIAKHILKYLKPDEDGISLYNNVAILLNLLHLLVKYEFKDLVKVDLVNKRKLLYRYLRLVRRGATHTDARSQMPRLPLAAAGPSLDELFEKRSQAPVKTHLATLEGKEYPSEEAVMIEVTKIATLLDRGEKEGFIPVAEELNLLTDEIIAELKREADATSTGPSIDDWVDPLERYGTDIGGAGAAAGSGAAAATEADTDTDTDSPEYETDSGEEDIDDKEEIRRIFEKNVKHEVERELRHLETAGANVEAARLVSMLIDHTPEEYLAIAQAPSLNIDLDKISKIAENQYQREKAQKEKARVEAEITASIEYSRANLSPDVFAILERSHNPDDAFAAATYFLRGLHGDKAVVETELRKLAGISTENAFEAVLDKIYEAVDPDDFARYKSDQHTDEGTGAGAAAGSTGAGGATGGAPDADSDAESSDDDWTGFDIPADTGEEKGVELDENYKKDDLSLAFLQALIERKGALLGQTPRQIYTAAIKVKKTGKLWHALDLKRPNEEIEDLIRDRDIINYIRFMEQQDTERNLYDD